MSTPVVFDKADARKDPELLSNDLHTFGYPNVCSCCAFYSTQLCYFSSSEDGSVQMFNSHTGTCGCLRGICDAYPELVGGNWHCKAFREQIVLYVDD